MSLRAPGTPPTGRQRLRPPREPGPPARARRTQAERRATTRGTLLSAAIETLVACGYGGFTTTEVCKRSGFSQGALFLHFPTKSALLAGTIQHLFGELVVTYQAQFKKIAGARDRLATAIDLLASVFCDERLLAALELYAASRTDPELRAHLTPVIAEHNANLRSVAHALFPESTRDERRTEALLGLALAAFQGLALGELIVPDPQRTTDILSLLHDIGATVLMPPAGHA